eukprot:scaffold102866_cov71-Phaeocystis_antarctica.AAC.3
MTYIQTYAVTRARPRRASPTPTSRSGEIGLGLWPTERPDRRAHAPSAEASSEMRRRVICAWACAYMHVHIHMQTAHWSMDGRILLQNIKKGLGKRGWAGSRHGFEP